MNFFRILFSRLKYLFALVVFISDTVCINSPAVYFIKNRNYPPYSFLTPGQVFFWTSKVNVR